MPEITTSDGARLHYEIDGRADGKSLVLSNSLGTHLRVWDALTAEAIGLGFRVIRYDQRGHGASPAPAGDYRIERLGTDVIELLDALDIERADFCGLSLGGMTGIWLAKNHPRKVARLALCNTAVWMPPRDLWDDRIRSVRDKGMASVVEGILGRWFTPAFAAASPDSIETIREMILSIDPAGYAGCAAAIRDMDMRDMLGLIESPTLVLNGAHDAATPPDRGDYIAERIPGAQKVVLDAAHLSAIERPEEFTRSVMHFLSGERP